jgi:hypothetical protein
MTTDLKEQLEEKQEILWRKNKKEKKLQSAIDGLTNSGISEPDSTTATSAHKLSSQSTLGVM